MAKFTKGPWEQLTYSNHDLQTDFAVVKIGSRVHIIGCSDEDKANARLIAACPDMFSILNECHDAMENVSRGDLPDGLVGRVLELIDRVEGD